jgi:hypothetical protein
MKANYKCRKCGMLANSKCAASRSVYTHKELDSVWSYFFWGDLKDEDGVTVLNLTHRIGQEVTPREAVQQLYDRLGRMLKAAPTTPETERFEAPTPEEWMCDHSWELLDEHCELGCCTKEVAT